MAMYLFASRLSSAVCTRRAHPPTTPRAPAPPPPPHRPSPAPSPVATTSAIVETQEVALQRGGVTRSTVGPCDRGHRCDSKVPSATKHRVRFANTFPRVNRRKRMSDSHDDVEVGGKDEDDSEVSFLKDRTNELVFRDGNLVSGSLEALVQRLVPTPEHRPDRAFLFAFLLSSRLFLHPNQLLGQLAFLYDISKPSNKEGTIPRLVQLLAEWMETFPYDFRDDRVMAHVRAIIRKCVTGSGTEEVSHILQTLLDRLTALQRYEEFLQRLSVEQLGLEDYKKDLMDLCPKPEEVAQQLTVIELERLSYIGPEEFLQAFAPSATASTSPRTRNLEAYVAWSHRLSYLVATEILTQTKKAKRVKVLEMWVMTAHSCLTLGNYNSLMSIIAGLNLSFVKRLKKTWTKTTQQKFQILESHMDAAGDFALYRATLKAASRRFGGTLPSPTTSKPEASDCAPTTIIPFFSLFLKDVFVLQEACFKKLPNGHINFERFWQMAKLVTEFITWQQISCPQPKDATLCLYLQSRRLYSEPELTKASFLCESPSTPMEQEQWRVLKVKDSTKGKK